MMMMMATMMVMMVTFLFVVLSTQLRCRLLGAPGELLLNAAARGLTRRTSRRRRLEQLAPLKIRASRPVPPGAARAAAQRRSGHSRACGSRQELPPPQLKSMLAPGAVGPGALGPGALGPGARAPPGGGPDDGGGAGARARPTWPRASSRRPTLDQIIERLPNHRAPASVASVAEPARQPHRRPSLRTPSGLARASVASSRRPTARADKIIADQTITTRPPSLGRSQGP